MEIKTMVIERRSNVWERVRRSHILNIASAARESDDKRPSRAKNPHACGASRIKIGSSTLARGSVRLPILKLGVYSEGPKQYTVADT